MWTEEKGKWMRKSMPAKKHNLEIFFLKYGLEIFE